MFTKDTDLIKDTTNYMATDMTSDTYTNMDMITNTNMDMTTDNNIDMIEMSAGKTKIVSKLMLINMIF